MKKTKASLWMLGITAVAAGGMLGASAARGELPTERAVAVRMCQVEMGDVEQVLAVSGTVRYETEYGAISPVSGVVETVYVQQGQQVRAGEPLFRLDGSMQAATVQAAMQNQQTLTQMVPAALTSSRVQEAAVMMEQLTVRAAADGVVQQVNVCEHGGVMAGTVAVALSGQEQRIQCSVVVRDAEKLSPGMQARVMKDDALLTMATLREIGPAQVNTATGQTVCQAVLTPVENISLPLGAQVEVEVILYGQTDVPVAPVEAISEDGMARWVAEGRSYDIPVEVIMADEVNCWVSLPVGATLVQSGGETDHGQRVKEMRE